MVAIGSDHAAFGFKNIIARYLRQTGREVFDAGAFDSVTPADYPDFAAAACSRVAEGGCEKAILVCGTGIGMSIAANKIGGIRCAHCSDTYSAKMARLHNDANVLAVGERVLGEGLLLEIVEAFLSTPFSGEERHKRRVDKITALERGDSL